MIKTRQEMKKGIDRLAKLIDKSKGPHIRYGWERNRDHDSDVFSLEYHFVVVDSDKTRAKRLQTEVYGALGQYGQIEVRGSDYWYDLSDSRKLLSFSERVLSIKKII